jgi:hypothetical protein
LKKQKKSRTAFKLWKKISDIDSEDIEIEEDIQNLNLNSGSPNQVSKQPPIVEIRKFLVINWKNKSSSPLKLIILNEFGDPCNSSLQELLDTIGSCRQQQEHEEQVLVCVFLYT